MNLIMADDDRISMKHVIMYILYTAVFMVMWKLKIITQTQQF